MKEISSFEKGVLIATWLQQGQKFDVWKVAKKLKCSKPQAYRIINQTESLLPLARDGTRFFLHK